MDLEVWTEKLSIQHLFCLFFLQLSSQLSDHSDCLNKFLVTSVALSRITANRNCHLLHETDTALVSNFSYPTYNCSSQKLKVFRNDKNKNIKKIQWPCIIFLQLPTQVLYRCKCVLKYLENLSSITLPKCSQRHSPWKDTVGSCFQL